MCWVTQPPQAPKCRHGGSRRSRFGAVKSSGHSGPLTRTRSPGSAKGTYLGPSAVSAIPSPCAPSLAMSTSWALVVTNRPQQELVVAGAPGDGRGDDIEHAPSGLRGHPGTHALHSTPARGRIAHDAAFSYGRPPRLELRLDQRDQPGPGASERERHRQRLGQGYEAHVGDDGTDGLRHERVVEMTRVAGLERDDPGIICQARVQLAVAYVDRINPRRTPGEERLREPAGRCTHVQRHDIGHGKAEVVEGGDQFQSSPRDVVPRGQRQVDRGASSHAGARPLLDHARDVDKAAANEVLGPRARWRKAQLDHANIEARQALTIRFALHRSRTFDPRSAYWPASAKPGQT